jgi:radical SAM protein with 4Fe4S-binding SPASM domain
MSTVPPEYGPLMQELHARAAKCRQPVNGAFELTNRCNLLCRMCYNRHGSCDLTKMATELSAARWLELARQAKDSGMVFLLLTGGEVFLRHDFFEIYEPLTRMGLMLTVFSNGTLITNEIAQRLAQAPPSRTEITLYGATAAVYETVTRVPGSFNACCSGIEALLSKGVPLALKTTLTRHNVHELEAMRQMAKDWGVSFMGSWMLANRPDGCPSGAENCRLSAEEAVALEATDRASASEWSEAALREGPIAKGAGFYCLAGKATFSVSPTGDMNACLMMPAPAARPLEIGFQAAWSQLVKYVDTAPAPCSTCRSCDAQAYCGRCPAYSLMENGTLTDPVPYWCDIARARKDYYGRPA